MATKKSAKKSSKQSSGRPAGSKVKFKMAGEIPVFIAQQKRCVPYSSIEGHLMKKFGKVKKEESFSRKISSMLLYLKKHKRIASLPSENSKGNIYGLPKMVKGKKPLPAFVPKKVKA